MRRDGQDITNALFALSFFQGGGSHRVGPEHKAAKH
jgi:hypothetical protein